MHETGVVEHPCMWSSMYAQQVVCYTDVLNASVQFANRCCRHQYTYLQTHSLQGMHMHSCMHSLFSLLLGDESGGVELVYVGRLFAGVEDYFDMTKLGVLSVFSLFFDGDWRVCRCMCVDAHTHILTASGYSGCEPKGRDGTFREHEKIQMD